MARVTGPSHWSTWCATSARLKLARCASAASALTNCTAQTSSVTEHHPAVKRFGELGLFSVGATGHETERWQAQTLTAEDVRKQTYKRFLVMTSAGWSHVLACDARHAYALAQTAWMYSGPRKQIAKGPVAPKAASVFQRSA